MRLKVWSDTLLRVIRLFVILFNEEDLYCSIVNLVDELYLLSDE